MTAPHPRWTAVLDDLADDLDRVEAALDVASEDEAWPAVLWTPPEDLGDLPTELVPRALDLRDRLADLEDELRIARGEALARVRAARTHRDVATAYHRAG